MNKQAYVILNDKKTLVSELTDANKQELAAQLVDGEIYLSLSYMVSEVLSASYAEHSEYYEDLMSIAVEEEIQDIKDACKIEGWRLVSELSPLALLRFCSEYGINHFDSDKKDTFVNILTGEVQEGVDSWDFLAELE